VLDAGGEILAQSDKLGTADETLVSALRSR
jgi:hypothetical protein